jgi:hypothetical protein
MWGYTVRLFLFNIEETERTERSDKRRGFVDQGVTCRRGDLRVGEKLPEDIQTDNPDSEIREPERS